MSTNVETSKVVHFNTQCENMKNRKLGWQLQGILQGFLRFKKLWSILGGVSVFILGGIFQEREGFFLHISPKKGDYCENRSATLGSWKVCTNQSKESLYCNVACWSVPLWKFPHWYICTCRDATQCTPPMLHSVLNHTVY